MLTISQAAKETGLSVKSIRHYEEIGLISPAPRGDNEYRYYPPNLIQQLHFIKKTKEAGFNLKESKALLTLSANEARRSADVKALLSEKIAELQGKIERQQAVLNSLKAITEKCCGDDKPDCPIIDAFTN
ncbi:MerR family transcriptional regulator [Psychromonas sp. MME2]|uniref:MerR family transcriptional regulator n=1 Tax=unclassified Psychromonas TaxID=2614957 RepID=UPI00339CC77D